MTARSAPGALLSSPFVVGTVATGVTLDSHRVVEAPVHCFDNVASLERHSALTVVFVKLVALHAYNFAFTASESRESDSSALLPLVFAAR